MDQTDIEVFLSIVQEKNIQRASNKLYLSPTTVGTRLKTLEKELGISLISRGKGIKEVSLTPKGEEFIPIAKKLMINFNECQNLKNTMATNKYLSVVIADSVLGEGLEELFRNLMYKEPFFHFYIKCYPADMIYTQVDNQNADIGFALYKMYKKNVLIEPIFSDKMVLIIPNNSTLKAKVHTNELDPSLELRIGSNEELFMGWGPEFKIWHDKYFDKSLTPILTASSITWLTYFFKGGNFWSIIPKSLAVGFCNKFNLKIIEIENTPPSRICYKIYNSNVTPKIEQSINLFNLYLEDFLEELFKKGIIQRIK